MSEKLKDKTRVRLKSTGKVHIKWGQDSPDAKFIEALTVCGFWFGIKDLENVSKDEEVTCGICAQNLFKGEVVETAKKSLRDIKPNLSLNLTKEAQEAVLDYTKLYLREARTINDIIIEMLGRYGKVIKSYKNNL